MRSQGRMKQQGAGMQGYPSLLLCTEGAAGTEVHVVDQELSEYLAAQGKASLAVEGVKAHPQCVWKGKCAAERMNAARGCFGRA